jgi:hypothetical protein
MVQITHTHSVVLGGMCWIQDSLNGIWNKIVIKVLEIEEYFEYLHCK